MSDFIKLAKDSSSTQNNLNPSNGYTPLLVRSNETLLAEEASTIVFQENVAGVAIWDNPNTTWDGADLDDEWGPAPDDGFVLDSGLLGVAGENTLGTGGGSATIFHITNPRNYFIERFGFDTLVLGTGTQSTANKTFSFTAGQTYIGRAYFDGTSTNTVTSATLTTTETSGTYTYEMSADGGANWQSITLNTSITFTNTGSDLRIRITEDGASTGVITAVFCQYQLG